MAHRVLIVHAESGEKKFIYTVDAKEWIRKDPAWQPGNDLAVTLLGRTRAPRPTEQDLVMDQKHAAGDVTPAPSLPSPSEDDGGTRQTRGGKRRSDGE